MRMQFGFMPGWGTTDLIFILPLIQKYPPSCKQATIHCLCGPRESILLSCKIKQAVNQQDVRSRMRVGDWYRDSEEFGVVVDVHYALSSFQFCSRKLERTSVPCFTGTGKIQSSVVAACCGCSGINGLL